MKLDLKSVFPAITAFIAFILTLCCLFAGTQKNLLDGTDLLTLYTPQGSANSTGHDFYSVHIMSYCHGTFETIEPGSEGSARNVTECSDRKLLFSFNPTEAWLEDISHGPNLEWPRVISDDFHAFRLTTRSMAVMYIIGVGAIGFALVARVVSLIASRVQHGLFEFGFLVLGALSLSIASIIATVIAFEFVALINAHGDGSNVSAKYGDRFLGMTWASTGLLLVGSISSFINIFVRGMQPGPAPAPKDEEEGD
ncbi:hypothetical protein N7532_000506 [Penicillium argentinense]|uniref:Actin cortical patch SUR7/pH-response regulator PalI n=1 Tax=Penicillium argentinense TaxID=1131581 RepID=A0A9W9G5N1_9EURO|nr:uncharacterized protein N7532_000506 [Penicillium argentinense]KAJ5112461.1 hypothetical protein N7532_000506 [Penicillium argentinense]